MQCGEYDLNIETLQQLVHQRRYQIKLHTLQHALQEGFGETNIIQAVLAGLIIEAYPDRKRVLICGRTTIDTINIYLHVVCQQDYPDQVEFITAYIPSRKEWVDPPIRRKRKIL